ncbi:hypothetical protein [Aeromicrobium sp. 9AM]|uniref:hypothetical protein n=1 Tax=Aeromicrobium sp. 9AM TaxID=2653126 RepID=UPI001F24798E|nr:hypothetical protein [Aeromicrobium sp. 9AM]
MPIETIAAFAALVREGPGNEQQRLDLLRAHEHRVRDDIGVLLDHLAAISGKVRAYERHVAEGRAANVWNPLRAH